MSDGEMAGKINTIFDLRPYAIVKRFGLKNPVFLETAAYGHMGRSYRKDNVMVYENGNANGGKKIPIQRTDPGIADDIFRAGDRISGHGYAAGQGLDHDQPERIGETGKHKHVGS